MFKNFLFIAAYCLLSSLAELSAQNGENPEGPTQACAKSLVAAEDALTGITEIFSELDNISYFPDRSLYSSLLHLSSKLSTALKKMSAEGAAGSWQKLASYLEGSELQRLAATVLISEMKDFILTEKPLASDHPHYQRLNLILKTESSSDNLTYIASMIELSTRNPEIQRAEWIEKFRKQFRLGSTSDQIRALETLVAIENEDTWLVPELYELFIVGAYYKKSTLAQKGFDESEEDWRIRAAKWQKSNTYGSLITLIIRSKFPFSEESSRSMSGMGLIHNPYDHP